jgi:predicted MFS family arabinose efflux permease
MFKGRGTVPQVAHVLIGLAGWRAAYARLAALIFFLAFPAVAWFVGRPTGDPEAVAWKLPNGDLPGLTGLEALRSVRFWFLAFSFFIVSGTTGGVISHLVPLLGDHGLSPETATGLMGIAGIALIAGRLLAGFLVDRTHAAVGRLRLS